MNLIASCNQSQNSFWV